MAAAHLYPYVVADLCLGKPPLPSLPATATVADAIAALKSVQDNCISVWSCDHSSSRRNCTCVGKLCMVDVVCFLCQKDNLDSPAVALKSPVSVLLPKSEGLVRHVEPSTSLVEAIDLILQGAQNLVIPIKTSSRRKHLPKSPPSPLIFPTTHNGQEFCWLTPEDIVRFLLGSIGQFSPLPTLSIDALGIITDDFEAADYHSPASSAVGAISRSLARQTSVAVVDAGGMLIGEISPSTLACCDETVSAAILTLSTGDLMAYIDCGGPPEEIVRLVEERLKAKKLEGMVEEFVLGPYSSNSASSDEDLPSPTTPLARAGRVGRSGSGYSARMVRRAEAMVCHRWSSLVAVMIQAIAHRVSYVWVIEDDDCTLLGIVTFPKMLQIFRQHLKPII
ncbi:CBS domain-containing protein CBSX5-like [Andrographis paniculata]|uniref:CBS domain-containing protein CBSX5-like n=1 Tax=Andrographis paniculata TaxID=175694 RepID=UPI0021E93427|nr:CBS domain-containing protein CBSX5-like [Andrographis paniculata]